MSSPTRPAVRRLASVLAATALLTGGIVAGTGTAAAGLPVTDVCGGDLCPPSGSTAAETEALKAVVTPLAPALMYILDLLESVGS